MAAEEADVAFKMLHNLLPPEGPPPMARFGVQQGAHCLACPGVLEDVRHFFIACPRVAAVWDQLHVASLLIPTLGRCLTWSCWSWLGRPRRGTRTSWWRWSSSSMHLVWTTGCKRIRPPSFAAYNAALRAKPAPFISLW